MSPSTDTPDPTRPVDPSRPIPPIEQPALLAALAAAVRRTDRSRARGRDRPGLGPGRPRRRARGPGRHPVRGAARLAGRDGAGPRRPPPHRASRRPRRGHAPGPLPPVRGQRPRAGHPARAAVQGGSVPGSSSSRTPRAGSIPSFGPGTLMVMRDHINLTGRSPLIGPNADELGPALPGPDRRLEPPAARAAACRRRPPRACRSREGIYVGLTGPTYETPAEVRMLAALGGHAVGMSTVLECIAARWVGLEVCGVSLVTNAGAGLHRRAAHPRGGPGRRAGRRAAPGPRHPPVRRGPAGGLRAG